MHNSLLQLQSPQPASSLQLLGHEIQLLIIQRVRLRENQSLVIISVDMDRDVTLLVFREFHHCNHYVVLHTVVLFFIRFHFARVLLLDEFEELSFVQIIVLRILSVLVLLQNILVMFEDCGQSLLCEVRLCFEADRNHFAGVEEAAARVQVQVSLSVDFLNRGVHQKTTGAFGLETHPNIVFSLKLIITLQ